MLSLPPPVARRRVLPRADRLSPAVVGARSATSPPGAALGFFQPLGGSGCPRTRAPVARIALSRVRDLGASRLFFTPQTPLGFSLQSLPLPKSRAAFRRPLAPLRFDFQARSPARRVRVLAHGFPRAPAGCPVLFALAGSEDATNQPGSRAPPCVRPPVHHPLARMAAATIARSRRARRLVARSPASKLCSPRKSVRARTARHACSSLRPNPALRSAPGPLLSWVCAPPKLSPPRSRVRSAARHALRAFGSPCVPRKTTPRSGTERGASILRPRPSEPGGRVGMAIPDAPPADAARVRAPSRRRPFLSCPLPCSRGRSCVGAVGLQRFEGRGSGPICVRSAGSLGVSRLLGVPRRFEASPRRWLMGHEREPPCGDPRPLVHFASGSTLGHPNAGRPVRAVGSPLPFPGCPVAQAR